MKAGSNGSELDHHYVAPLLKVKVNGVMRWRRGRIEDWRPDTGQPNQFYTVVYPVLEPGEILTRDDKGHMSIVSRQP